MIVDLNRTQKPPRRKPTKQTNKPYPDFPLTRHPSGRWCKKIRGRLHYFGPIDDPDGALRKYVEQRDRLQAGLSAVAPTSAPTLRYLVNAFLTEKQRQADDGDITHQSFEEYKRDCGRVIETLSRERTLDELTPDDFARLRVALRKDVGPVTASGRVRRCRTLFRYAFDVGLSSAPLRYSKTLTPPPRRALRLAKAEGGLKMMEADELRQLFMSASPMMKAALLLAVNCGFGNRDVATITVRQLDLKGGWLSMPRRKTGVMRRCPLWTETIDALQKAIAARPTPKDPADSELVLLSRFGTPLVQEEKTDSGRLTRIDLVSQGFAELTKRIGIKRDGLTFYAARHTLQTIGEETGDFAAVRAIMGHASAGNDMAAEYRARMTDERLIRVSEHVRRWLFG